MTADLEALVSFARSEDRVCPRPIEWHQFYELIGGKRTDLQNPWRVIWEPAPPLVLSAWGYASDAEKGERLREHIAWSAMNGTGDAADKYLRGLPLEAWHRSSALKPRY